jgi:drug/metabolite transporter (DMT)-like permease
MTLTDHRKLKDKDPLGIFLMLIGITLYLLSDAFVKHLMETYSVPQITFLRAITRLIPLMIAVFFQGGIKQVFSTKHPERHLGRLLVSLIFTFSFMYAFSTGSLTTIYTLSYTSPFFIIILSAIMLKEPVKFEKWVAVGIGLMGVIVAMRPGSSVFELGAILVLFATFLGALNKMLMRRLASTEHSLAIAIYPNLSMMLIIFPYLLLTDNWEPMPWSHWKAFAIVGAITAGGQYAIAQSLRFAQGSTLAPIDYSSFIWVVMLDLFWWNKAPDGYTLLGAAIIVGSNLFILYRTKKGPLSTNPY